MDIEAQKRQAAALAVEWVRPGMRLGLGTGSTARHFVELLAERVRAGLDVVGVADLGGDARPGRARWAYRSPRSTRRPQLDLTVDGADEIAPDLSLIKGGGGALLREKIVAAASARMVVIADESKWVSALGRFPLPIEVVPFGLAATRRAVEAAAAAAGCPGQALLRRDKDGHAFVTDGGHWILDAALGRIADAKFAGRPAFAPFPAWSSTVCSSGMAQAAILAGPAGVRVVERP